MRFFWNNNELHNFIDELKSTFVGLWDVSKHILLLVYFCNIMRRKIFSRLKYKTTGYSQWWKKSCSVINTLHIEQTSVSIYGNMGVLICLNLKFSNPTSNKQFKHWRAAKLLKNLQYGCSLFSYRFYLVILFSIHPKFLTFSGYRKTYSHVFKHF